MEIMTFEKINGAWEDATFFPHSGVKMVIELFVDLCKSKLGVAHIARISFYYESLSDTLDYCKYYISTCNPAFAGGDGEAGNGCAILNTHFEGNNSNNEWKLWACK